MPKALASSYISANQLPKVFAWIKRFDEAVKEAKTAGPKPMRVTIDELIKHMSKSRFFEPVGEVDASEPTALKAGDPGAIGSGAQVWGPRTVVVALVAGLVGSFVL